MLAREWLEKQDDYTISDNCCSWEKDGKYYFYDDNGCWETTEFIDVSKFKVIDDEAYYGDEIVGEFFDRVILDDAEIEV